jgi:hypothetical protein
MPSSGGMASSSHGTERVGIYASEDATVRLTGAMPHLLDDLNRSRS